MEDKLINVVEEWLNKTTKVCHPYDIPPYDAIRYALCVIKEQERQLLQKQRKIDKLQAKYADLRHRFLGKTEIIRCKDCKHSWLYCADKYGEIYECYLHDIDELEVHKANWFCADGEPKD